jgi:AraC family transcriptional regulator, exoenzyme S synthesis regulatory protein ExsA
MSEPARILYSCYTQVSREGEHFVPQHVFGYIISGSTTLYANGQTLTFNAGDFRFMRRNQLARFSKYPPAEGGDFKTISIGIDQETLRSISTEYNLHMAKPYTGEDNLTLDPDPLLKNYIDSLTPYLDDNGGLFSKELTQLKVREAVILLIKTNPALKDVLFDFSEPGKIDLEAYMIENYKYNVDMKRYAYLTGRSLATFKRDFEKIFHTSPNRWLQQKRLEDAYFLIREKKMKPSDVYLEVGFKDFSHFSFAFRKAFGATPSSV